MIIKTFDDVRRAHSKVDVPIESIARAFGIPVPESENERLIVLLWNATTQTERWRIWHDVQRGSGVEAEILREILKHATTTEERWAVYHKAPDGSDVKNEAIRELVSHI